MKVLDAAIILVLSLAVWLFFYLFRMPLDALSTTVVVAFFAVVVVGIRVLVKRRGKKRTR